MKHGAIDYSGRPRVGDFCEAAKVFDVTRVYAGPISNWSTVGRVVGFPRGGIIVEWLMHTPPTNWYSYRTTGQAKHFRFAPYFEGQFRPSCPACRTSLFLEEEEGGGEKVWQCFWKHCGAMFPHMTELREIWKHLKPVPV